VLSHRPAGTLHDLCSPPNGRIDVTVPARIGRSRQGIRVHSGDRMAPDEVTVVNGIRCTSVSRTILDVASLLQGRALEGLCERADRIEVFDPYELHALLARHRGRRGVARLRALVAEWDPDLARTNSELEVRFLRLIVGAGIERPIVNGLVSAGGETFEVDFHWLAQRVIVETDGAAFHDNPLARARDTERDRLLTETGWSVRRFGWIDVVEQPARTLAVVHGLLAPSGR
jgi:hypothetical protein